MEKKLSKGREIAAIIGIFLCGFAVFHDLAVTVIYNDLYATFPDNMLGVNIIVACTMAIAMIGALLAPYVLKLMSKRTLLIIASFVYAVTAILGAWKVDLLWMNIDNAICAISAGMITVCAAGLITDLYIDDEEKRARIMGFYNGFGSFAGAILSYGAGLLAVDGWTNVYNIYWSAVPIAILMIFLIPRGIKPASSEAWGEADAGGQEAAGEVEAGTSSEMAHVEQPAKGKEHMGAKF